VKLLLDRGADVNAQGGRYGNALQAAASEGRQETVKLLLDYGADVTIQPRNTNRSSVLHVCVASGSTATLNILLHAGATIHLDTQDESGQTPLHVAVEKRGILAAKYLLEKGASTDIPDLGDATPFQLALRYGYSELALLLFPATKHKISVSATQWRRCLAEGRSHHIEMVGSEPPEVLVRNDALEMKLNELSYPLSSYNDKLPVRETDFMSRKDYAKRILYVFTISSDLLFFSP
jgi:ankyrin repeat protein